MVLVTGASSGIGRATALLLARRGWFVIGSVRSAVDAADLSAAAGAVGVGALVEAIRLDVTVEGSIADAVVRVRERLAARGERLVGLVNNAGIAVAGPIEEVPLDRLRAALAVNVVGVVAVTQALLPLLARRSRADRQCQQRLGAVRFAVSWPLCRLEVRPGGDIRCAARGVAPSGNRGDPGRAGACGDTHLGEG